MNILIIGATSGIGKALFLKYANADNRIGIVGRRTELLNELSQQYPSKTIVSKADVTAENGGYPPTQNGDIRSLF